MRPVVVISAAVVWLGGAAIASGAVVPGPQPCYPECGGGGGGGTVLAPVVPGGPRHWEEGIDVASYSTVNVLNGNVLTTFPIVSWNGLGPDVQFNLYHNSADGVWRYSYSRELLEITPGEQMKLVMDDAER